VIRQAERRWRSRRGDLFPEAPALAWPTLTEDGAELARFTVELQTRRDVLSFSRGERGEPRLRGRAGTAG